MRRLSRPSRGGRRRAFTRWREGRGRGWILIRATLRQREKNMANLDWSQCPAVESVPGRLGGAWVFKDTRMPVSAVFENLRAGSDIEEIIEQFHVTREQIQAVLDFAARSLEAQPVRASAVNDAR